MGTQTATTEGATLRSQIETEFQKQNLSGVVINVTADTIELTGTVPTGKDKQTAKRIASSFAGNRRVVDRLTVTGRGEANRSPNSPNSSQNDPSRADEDREQVDPNQQPNNDPNKKGDASKDPR
jgi:osmotically-inducible protein OsmY